MLPEMGLVFDAGTGAFRIRDHLKTDRLDIFLSHTHLDHVFGLTSLLGLFPKDDPNLIGLHAQPENLAAIREHLFTPLLFPVKPNFTFVPLESEQKVACGGTLSVFPLLGHPGDSVGYRLDLPDRSMAYVTDTIASADADYVRHLQDVDLLIHEANFDDDDRDFANLTGHSCLPDVVDVAVKASAKRLVLVHLNPKDDVDEPYDLTESRKRFANVTIGADGDVIEF